MRVRGDTWGDRRRLVSLGLLLVGSLAVAPLDAADGAACASPGWLGREVAGGTGSGAPASLAERMTLRFGHACERPFVVALDLRLHFADRRTPLTVRSVPREFRPGERFLPGESYLVSRAFPESAELLAELFEGGDCGAARVVGSLTLAALDADPDAAANRATCVLVLGVFEPAYGDAAARPGARLAIFFAQGPA